MRYVTYVLPAFTLLLISLFLTSCSQTQQRMQAPSPPPAPLGGGQAGAPFRVNIIPPSPEVSALAEYVEVPVSLYTGTPDITIPLYTLQERDLALPVTLTYHTSGHKVEDEAPRTGLGWSLNAGGVIGRVIRGLPDEYSPGLAKGFLAQAAEMGSVGAYALGSDEQRFQWYDKMAAGCRDAEPDVFYFNFGGYAGKFQFDWDGSIVVDSSSKLIIMPLGLNPNDGSFIRGWQVQTPDGLRYRFDVREATTTRNSSPLDVINDPCRTLLESQRPPQSWYLAEIFSASSDSSIFFDYADYHQVAERWSLETQIHNAFLSPATPKKEKMVMDIAGKYLRSIRTSSGQPTINFIPGLARTDVTGEDLHTLGAVQVKDRNGTVVRNWDLGYDYRIGRLTLISLQEAISSSSKPPYRFEYYSGSLPDPLSFRSDHWGFFNDNAADTLIPATVVSRMDQQQVDLAGADRSPSPGRLTVGMLKKITYPAGGSDTFEFEPHEYSYQQNDKLEVQQMRHMSVGGSAPDEDWPPGVLNEKRFPISLHDQLTDLKLTVRLTCTCPGFACSTVGSVEARVEKSNGDVLVQLTPPCFLNPNGEPPPTFYEQRIPKVAAGSYVLVVGAKGFPTNPALGRNSISASVGWDETTGESTVLRQRGGGVRVARITRAGGLGNPDQVTRYLYTMQDGSREISSGSLLASGLVYELWSTYVHAEGCHNEGCINVEEQKFVRFSQNRSALGTTQGSHVGYKQVTVLQGAGGENGRTVYRYTSPIDFPDFQSFTVPFPPATSADYKRGLLLDQSDYAANGTSPVRTIAHRYAFHARTIPALKVGWAKPAAGEAISGAGFLDRYAWEGYSNRLGYARLIETKETSLYPAVPGPGGAAATSHEKTTTYAYAESGHRQLISTTVLDSEGKQIVTAYKYPTDYPRGTSAALDRLVDSHMLDRVVETATYRRASGAQVQLISALRNAYALFGGVPRLAQVLAAELATPLVTTNPFKAAQTLYEQRLTYRAYDAHGNLLEHAAPDGMITAYHWDERATLPVAAAEHAKTNQIFYTSFEDTPGATSANARTGSRSLLATGAYQVPASSLPGEPGDYILSYWHAAAAGPWSRAVLLIPNYQPGTPIATTPIDGFLDEVRLYPVTARMRTLTYQPLTGITTETDFNDVSTFYAYDRLGRLAAIRDSEGSIVTAYAYHLGYAGDPAGLNYVRTYTPQVAGIQTQAQLAAALAGGEATVLQSTKYQDGLARVVQQVQKGASARGRDVVNIVAYDAFGRKAQRPLPFTMDQANGEYKVFDPLHHPLQEFYGATGDKVANTRKPFAITRYDRSPLNRVIEQGAAGEAWQPGAANSHTLAYTFRANTAADAVLLWRPHQKGLVASSLYEPNSLQLAVTTDEDRRGHRTFKDRQDRTVLELAAGKYGETLPTYYVYDLKGNLTDVVPPKTAAASPGPPATITAGDLAQGGYRHAYDGRDRLVEQALPGAAPAFMVYDRWDRLVLRQDGVQRAADRWTFYKYDAFDRVIMSGEIVLPGARSELQQRVDNFYASAAPLLPVRYETGGDFHGYTNRSFPVLAPGAEVNVVTYFDDYSALAGFPAPARFQFQPQLGVDQPLNKAVGRQTAEKVRILGTSRYLYSVTYYDAKYRPIQAVRTRHNGSLDRVTSTYTFTGKLEHALSTHHQDGTRTAIAQDYVYDHAGRLLDVYHKVNDAERVLLYRQAYNELDEPVEKNLYSADGGATFAQSVDYRYNIRGWLTSINNAALQVQGETNDDANDLFGMELFYDVATNRLGNIAQYNGNISALQWQNAHFAEEHAYFYRYDAFNRLQKGRYKNFAHPEQQGAYDETAIEYDANGNLVGLERYRWQDAARTLIDGLAYTLAGNQLQRVQDSSGRAQGFRESGTPGDDYGYDANGNTVLDRNKSITVTYNHLNLPVRITDRSGAAIQYTYDAQGAKLVQTVFDGTATVVTDYVGDFVYENGGLRYIAHDAGILVPAAAGSGWVYHYYLPDHLGSVRVTFAVRPQGPAGRPTATIVQAADYYPFGWQLGGHQFQAQNAPPIDHLYNGKEFQDEIGLNWYDYGARMYDPALGRWHVVDPAAETYYSHSPYAYTLNNPVLYTDPDGRQPGSYYQKLLEDRLKAIIKAAKEGRIDPIDLTIKINEAIKEYEEVVRVSGLDNSIEREGLSILTVFRGFSIADDIYDFFSETNKPASLDPPGMPKMWIPPGKRGKYQDPYRETSDWGSTPLPKLDSTGKVHGQLPKASELGKYSANELRRLQEDLKASIQERIRVTVQKGDKGGHGQRQAAEELLVRQIEKHLEGR